MTELKLHRPYTEYERDNLLMYVRNKVIKGENSVLIGAVEYKIREREFSSDVMDIESLVIASAILQSHLSFLSVTLN